MELAHSTFCLHAKRAGTKGKTPALVRLTGQKCPETLASARVLIWNQRQKKTISSVSFQCSCARQSAKPATNIAIARELVRVRSARRCRSMPYWTARSQFDGYLMP